MTKQTLLFDTELRAKYPTIVGCDEVGRGCLAGPIVTAAVILPANIDIDGVIDSKKVRKRDHEMLAERIMAVALEIQLGLKTAAEIDQTNILAADKNAMRDSIARLHHTPDLILIDGNKAQELHTKYTEQTIIKGDATSLSIAAASIIAKYTRDKLMTEYDKQYPGYGWARNDGYGTKEHREALAKLGITPQHRKTFEPVKSHLTLWPKNLGVAQ